MENEDMEWLYKPIIDFDQMRADFENKCRREKWEMERKQCESDAELKVQIMLLNAKERESMNLVKSVFIGSVIIVTIVIIKIIQYW